MIEYKQLGNGIWHVTRFFPDNQWEDIKKQILALPDDTYNERHEPLRNRFDLTKSPATLKPVFDWANAVTPEIKQITQSNMSPTPGVVLWRDSAGFRSGFHSDDFTKKPTVQIYVDGDTNTGTAFIIDNKEVRLQFIPNTGYIMDNQFQPCHGTVYEVGNKIRQSIYLIYF